MKLLHIIPSIVSHPGSWLAHSFLLYFCFLLLAFPLIMLLTSSVYVPLARLPIYYKRSGVATTGWRFVILCLINHRLWTRSEHYIKRLKGEDYVQTAHQWYRSSIVFLNTREDEGRKTWRISNIHFRAKPSRRRESLIIYDEICHSHFSDWVYRIFFSPWEVPLKLFILMTFDRDWRIDDWD